METERVGLGGGCHWCTEAVFQAVQGVSAVEQGFVRSVSPNDSWSEGVIVNYDPTRIDLHTLIEVHVRTHAATRAHSRRETYRSAVYAVDDARAEAARQSLYRLQPEFPDPLITKVLALRGFKPSDVRFQNYYRTDPERPFCRRHIDPKLALIRERFASLSV